MTRDLGDWLSDEADRAPALDPATVPGGLELGRARVARRRRTGRAAVGGAVAAVVAVAVTATVVADRDDRRPPEPGPATSTPPEADDALPVRTAEGGDLVGCGYGPAFLASSMPAGLPDVLTDAEVRSAFAKIYADGRIRGAVRSLLRHGADGVEWRVLGSEGATYAVGIGPWTATGPEKGGRLLVMTRSARGWESLGSGRCEIQPVLKDDHSWVVLSGYAVPDPTDSAVVVSGSERECTSARDPRDHLQPLAVVETDTSVTVYVTTVPVDGPAKCPGNPGASFVVPLDRPLGDRVVLDGSTYPAHPLRVR